MWVLLDHGVPVVYLSSNPAGATMLPDQLWQTGPPFGTVYEEWNWNPLPLQTAISPTCGQRLAGLKGNTHGC